jgi:hypothetical protein
MRVPLAVGRLIRHYLLGPPGVAVPFKKIDNAAAVTYWLQTARKIGASMDRLARGLR